MSGVSLNQATLEAKQIANTAAAYEGCGINTDGLRATMLTHFEKACGASADQIGHVGQAFDDALATRSTQLETQGLSCRGSEDEAVSRLMDQLRAEHC